MDRGYVKLWRCSEDDALFADPLLWQMWCLLLMRASYKETEAWVQTGRGKTLVRMLPGQVFFGRKSWGKKLSRPGTNVERSIKKLEKLGKVSIQPGTHYSIITLVNWTRYNELQLPADPPTEHPTGHPTDTQPNTQPGTSKKVKHLEHSEKVKTSSSPSATDAPGFAEFWNAYPRKIGKGDARKVWNKLKL